VLYNIEAETETGGHMQVTARRAAFGPHLLDKAKVMGLVQMAAIAAKDAERENKSGRLDKMAAIASEVLDLLGAPLPSATLWSEVARAYGSEPNGAERKQIADRLGLAHKREGAANVYVLRESAN
jgi:hypothetical protein